MTSRRANYKRGIAAEYVALIYLMLKGYLPLAMRFKTTVGEIDLVMRRGRTLVFVEVKARKTMGDAAASIHATNQSRVVRASQVFLTTRPHYQSLQVRFDAVLIAWYTLPHHQPNAF